MSDRIEPAPDTSDERLAELLRWTGQSGMPDVHALLLDLQGRRHRAVRTDSAERVREVVLDAALWNEGYVHPDTEKYRHATRIADRVVAQLTGEQQSGEVANG